MIGLVVRPLALEQGNPLVDAAGQADAVTILDFT